MREVNLLNKRNSLTPGVCNNDVFIPIWVNAIKRMKSAERMQQKHRINYFEQSLYNMVLLKNGSFHYQFLDLYT